MWCFLHVELLQVCTAELDKLQITSALDHSIIYDAWMLLLLLMLCMLLSKSFTWWDDHQKRRGGYMYVSDGRSGGLFHATIVSMNHTNRVEQIHLSHKIHMRKKAFCSPVTVEWMDVFHKEAVKLVWLETSSGTNQIKIKGTPESCPFDCLTSLCGVCMFFSW